MVGCGRSSIAPTPLTTTCPTPVLVMAAMPHTGLVLQTLTSPSAVLMLLGGAAATIWAVVVWVSLNRREPGRSSAQGARALVWIVGLGPALVAVFAPRAVLSADNAVIDAPPLSGIALHVSQALTLTGLTLSVLIIASQHWPNEAAPKRPGRGVAASLLAIYAAVAVAALLAGHGGFGRKLFVLPIPVIALYLAPRQSAPRLVGQLRMIFRAYVYGSLIALIIAPDWAVYAIADARDYFHIGGQLSGLTSHPNVLGPIAATALILEFVPFERRRTWPIHVAASLTVLLLAQSRMGLIAAVVGLLFLTTGRRSLRPMRWVVALVGAAAAASFVLSPHLAQVIQNAFVGNTDLLTLNGRIQVWRYAYNQFLLNPFTGYGPNLFNPKGAGATAGAFPSWAGQAHNQIFQTLGETGIIGMVALVALVAALVTAAAKRSRVLAGLSSGMTAIMLTRFVTEAPLAGFGGFDQSFALLFVLIAVLITPLDDAEIEYGAAVSALSGPRNEEGLWPTPAPGTT